MQTREQFIIEQMHELADNAMTAIAKATELQNQFVAEENYVKAEGMRVSITMNQGLLKAIARILNGETAFEPSGQIINLTRDKANRYGRYRMVKWANKAKRSPRELNIWNRSSPDIG